MAEQGFFSWVKPALRSKRTMKTWLRCCVALVTTLVLMVATKPSNTMGQAAFFAVIVSVMLPPNMALSVFVLASTTLLLGMLLGWAWGNAAIAAAQSARSASLLATQTQSLPSKLDPNVPAALRAQAAIFHGAFLDPRSSAVYGAFLFIGTFAMASLQAVAPNMALLCIFAIIVIDVVCTTGPLLPTANYLIAKSFIIPSTFSLAVSIACLVFIFPQSLSHAWLTSLTTDFLKPTLALLRLQSEALASRPSDTEAWAERNAKGVELRTALTQAVEAVTGQIKLIDLDVSIGRLGPADLKKINGELKYIMFHARGLHAFHAFVTDTNATEKAHAAADQARAAAALSPHSRRSNNGPGIGTGTGTGTGTPFQTILAQIKAREVQHGHDLDTLVPILFASSAALRGATEAALEAIIEFLDEANTRRLTGLVRKDDRTTVERRQERLNRALGDLLSALAEFRSSERVRLIRPFEKFFDPVTRRPVSEDFASRSLYICFVFIDTLGTFSDRIYQLLRIITDIDAQRTKVRVWFPGRVVAVKEKILGNDFKGAGGPLALGTPENPEAFKSREASRMGSATSSRTAIVSGEDGEGEGGEREGGREMEMEKEGVNEGIGGAPAKRNPDAFPPKTAAGRSFVKLAAFFQFFKSAEGVYALRMGFISVALWIPTVCESSAWFYYDNKGLWAMIMAQTGLAVYAGDQIAGFVTRLSGTVIGLLLGMAAWYIGAGRGHGNPYGLVIITTVAIAPFLLGRIAGPPSQTSLWSILGVTIIFVVGYSWINANHVVLANPGVGVTLGWKRALLVIIGFTAAFIVMLFPHPKSSRVLVRKTLAAIINEEGHIFVGEVEAFLAEEERGKRGELEEGRRASTRQTGTGDDEKDFGESSVKEKRILKIAKRFIDVSGRLTFIEPSLTTAKYEPQLAGTWPHEQYQQLFTLQSRILGSLALLITAFAKLDTKWCRALIHRTPYMNPNFLSDVFMTITILSNTLMSGTPLPASLPKLRDRIIYHSRLHGDLKSWGVSPTRKTGPMSSGSETAKDDSSLESVQNMEDTEPLDRAAGPSNVDGASMGFEDGQLTLDVLLNEQLPVYSTAIVALSNLISRLDDTIDIVKTLCGEASFQGYDALQRDFLDREEKSYGRY